MFYQLSYEATHWEQGQFVGFISSRAVEWHEVYNMYNTSYLYCGATVQKWIISYILLFISLHGKIWSQQMTSLPMCGFIAQLTSIAEVTGSTPVEAPIFTGLHLSNCLNWKMYCDDHPSLSACFLLWQKRKQAFRFLWAAIFACSIE